MNRAERTAQIAEELKEKKIPLIYIYFAGPYGELNNKVFLTGIDKAHMDISLLDGIAVNGQLLPGWEKSSEAEWLLLIPELEMLRCHICSEPPSAFLLGSFLNFSLDSRECAKRAVAFAKKAGYTPFCGSSLVYGITGENVTAGNDMMKLLPDSTSAKLNYEITRALSDNSISIEYYQALSPSHSVLDILPTEFADQLDNYAFTKMYARSVCEARNIRIEYTSPKFTIPLSDNPIHLSLWNKEKTRNLFFDEYDEMELSVTGKQFVAGILAHASELSLLIPQDGRQTMIEKWDTCYSIHRDRSLVNIPVYLKEKKKHDRVGWGKRILFNGLSHRCNHYTSASAVLIAGIDGINNDLSLEEIVKQELIPSEDIGHDSIFRKVMGNELVDYLVKKNEKDLSV